MLAQYIERMATTNKGRLTRSEWLLNIHFPRCSTHYIQEPGGLIRAHKGSPWISSKDGRNILGPDDTTRARMD